MSNIDVGQDVLSLSSRPKTWILDLDGTLVRHNGYLEGRDILLEGRKSFLEAIPETDYILILTSRPMEYKEATLRFLNEQNIRFDQILFGLPAGERILLNDRKPTGLNTAVAVNLARNQTKLPQIITGNVETDGL